MSGQTRIRAFTMPKWGIEMEEGVVREWRPKIGDAVREGDLIAVIETDKIANDVELEFSAVLRRLIASEGETYKVGALLAVFSEAGVAEGEVDAFISSFKAADAGFGHEAPAKAATAPAPEAAIPAGLAISPKALELARARGVDLSKVTGSGPGGRVSLQDVEQAVKAQGLDASGEEDNPSTAVKLTSMRRAIAKRMSEAARTVPHIYLRTDVFLDRLKAARKETPNAPSVTDYLIKASALALKAAPEVNAHFINDEILRYEHADIAVAVALPGGLVAPVLRRAETKPVAQISAELRDLVARARAEKLAERDLKGGTFSLSNLGMFGVTSFDAIVSPPMVAILAIGAARPGDGGGSIMTATLSCDHRALDGAVGGEFLAAFKRAVESPETL